MDVVLAGSKPSPVLLSYAGTDGERLGCVYLPGGRRLKGPLGLLLVMHSQLVLGNMQPSSGPVNH